MPESPYHHDKYSKAETALQLASQGLHVFPIYGIRDNGLCECGNEACKNPGKHPRLPNGLKGATTIEGTIRAWWEAYPKANIGVVTGEASGIIVLDVDGAEGRESLNGHDLPDTVTVASGRDDGGCHYWFSHPGYEIRNSASKIGKGLDIRGDGGYVIVPPSRHKSGKPYQWGSPEGFDREAVAEAPDWLLKLIEEKETDKGPRLGFRPTIPNGERNDTLYREGCKLRGLGASEEAIHAYLQARNKDCAEPLDEAEILTIAKSAASHDPNPDLQTYRNTDVGNGKRLVRLYGDQIRYYTEQKTWLFWDDRRWREDKWGRVQRLAKATVQETFDLAVRVRDADLESWTAETERRNGIGRMIQSAQSEDEISVTAEDLDQSPMLFNVRNGTLNLTTGEFLAHNPKQMLTKLAPVDFDPEATAPKWEAFLAEIFNGDEDLIGYVQRVLGYCLTGDMREQALFIAYGGGANGKSTLLNTVRKLLGDYAANTPFSTFEADNRNQYGNDMAALKGSRFVTAIESEQDKRLAEARVKAITGGDPITCRFLYGEYFTMEPHFKVWLAVNHKPTIRGMERGIWRRIHLIPFTQSFEGRADKALASKLEAEAPGILNWMIEGLRQWQEQGLEPIPDSVKQATDEYKREMDTLGEWIEERATVAEEATGSASDLYADYRQWSESRGEDRYKLTQKGFSTQLGERGFTKVHTKKGRVFLGIGLEALRMSEVRGN